MTTGVERQAKHKKEAQNEEEYHSLPSSKWIDENLGTEFANLYNRLMLARVLDGVDRKYRGLVGRHWLPSLESIGFSVDQHGVNSADVIAFLKRKYVDTKRQTPVDDTPPTAVQLGFSVFNPNVKVKVDSIMTDNKNQASEAKKAEREAAKAAKLAEREAKKAEREAAKAAKLAEREAAKAARQAAREAARAERAAKLAELGGSPKMAALRSAKERYVKAKNGSLRSNDEIAQAFDGLTPDRTIATCMNLLGLGANPYAHLNIGQQSMNLRNKLRTAVKRGVISIDAVRAAVRS